MTSAPDAGDLPEPPADAVLYYRIGEQARQTGYPREADRAYTASLALLDAAEIGDHPLRAAILNGVGLVRYSVGEYQQAASFLVEALRVYERVGRSPKGTAIALDNLGMTELALAVEAGISREEGYVNAVAEEHLGRGERYFSRALELFEAGLPITTEDYVTCLLNNAELATRRPDPEALEQLSVRAAEFLEDERVTDVTRWLVVALRGEVLLARGAPAEAVEVMAPWFEDLVGRIEPWRLPTRGLPSLVRAAALVGDHELAREVAGFAIRLDDRRLEHQLAEASQSAARRLFAEFSARTAMFLGSCAPWTPGAVLGDWLYELTLNRKGVLAEREGSAWLRARANEGASAELLARVREMRAEVAHVDLDGSHTGAIAAARRRYTEAERELNAAEEALHRELSAGSHELAHVTVDDLRARLGPDTMLLDFLVAERPDGVDHYLMVTVRSEGPVRVKDLGPAAEVGSRLTAWKSKFETPPRSTDATGRPPSNSNPNHAPTLFAPGDTLSPHIVIAPTGVWAQIPFGLLPDCDGRPLFESHTVSLAPSARGIVTRAQGTPTNRPGPSMVVGDPDFDLDFSDHVSFFLSMRYARLEQAAAETEQVAGLLGVEPLTGPDATRKRLLEAQRPRILHIATHAVFLDAISSVEELSEPRSQVSRNVGGTPVTEDLDENFFGFSSPARETTDAKSVHRRRVQWLRKIGPSGQLSRSTVILAGFNAWLAGAPTPSDVGTGMVSAGEFAMLDLRSTQLVVLSACETGVGAVDYADGSLMGLRTAAISAGAACCVSTLWKVDDTATASLMRAFYEALATGETPAAALRAAQLAIRDVYPDPYFWAGWVAKGFDQSPSP